MKALIHLLLLSCVPELGVPTNVPEQRQLTGPRVSKNSRLHFSKLSARFGCSVSPTQCRVSPSLSPLSFLRCSSRACVNSPCLFTRRYPFLLPNLVVALLAVASLPVVLFFLPETLTIERGGAVGGKRIVNDR